MELDREPPCSAALIQIGSRPTISETPGVSDLCALDIQQWMCHKQGPVAPFTMCMTQGSAPILDQVLENGDILVAIFSND